MNDRKEGDHDHDGDHQVQVLFNVRDRAPQEITDSQHAEHPQDAAEHVEKQELFIIHLPRARHCRRESPHDRHKARQDNGLSSVALKEVMRPLQIFALEENGIRPVEEPRPREIADRVSRAVPQDRCGHQKSVQGQKIKLPLRRHKPRGHQERISGKKKTSQDPCFAKNNDRKRRVTAPGDQSVQIVDLREKIG